MVDRIKTHLPLAEAEITSTVGKPQADVLVEADADALMDDLFGDIDRILDGGSKLPTATAQRESSASPAPGLSTTPLRMPAPAASASTATAAGQRQPRRSPPRRTSQQRWQLLWQQHVDKILFGIACLALVGVTAGLALQSRLPWQRRLPVPQDAGASLPLPAEDSRFIGYMLRSLKTIERQDEAIAQATGLSQPTASQLPAVPDDASARTIERVYIPVYPPNPSRAATVVPAAPSRDRPAAEPRAADASPALPSPSSTETEPDNPAAATAVRPPEPESLQATALPQFDPLPNLPSLAELQLPPEDRAADRGSDTGDYKLVGLLESGDRSAALFEIDGTTQRVSIDEPIGETGWRLVSAANQVAIVERRGETRSLYVGQSF